MNKFVELMPNSGILCASCGSSTGGSYQRIVVDSCGHSKCRKCLLVEENDCSQCLLGGQSFQQNHSVLISDSIINSREYDDEINNENEVQNCFQNRKSVIISTPTINRSFTDEEEYDSQSSIASPESTGKCSSDDSDEDNSVYSSVSDVTGQIQNVNNQNYTVDEWLNKNDFEFECIEVEEDLNIEAQSNYDHQNTIERGILVSQDFLNEIRQALPQKHKSKSSALDLDHIEQFVDLEGKTKYSCTICKRNFNNRSNRKYHIPCADESAGFTCEQCDRKFKCSSHLTYHIRSVHTKERPYKCKLCNMAFHQSVKLKRHNLQHTGERPFTCDICQKNFKTNYHLKEHKNIHQASLHYKCSECDKTFADKNNLGRHFKLFHTNKSQVCKKCDLVCRTKHDLEVHMLTHKNKECPKMSCQLCGKKFRDNKDLSRHLIVHTNEKKFKCSLCDKLFGRKDHLQRHNLKIHMQTRKCADLSIIENTDNVAQNDSEDEDDPLFIDPEISIPPSVITNPQISVVLNEKIGQLENKKSFTRSPTPNILNSIDSLPSSIYNHGGSRLHSTEDPVREDISNLVKDISKTKLQSVIDKIEPDQRDTLKEVLINANIIMKDIYEDKTDIIATVGNNVKKSLLNRYRKQSGIVSNVPPSTSKVKESSELIFGNTAFQMRWDAMVMNDEQRAAAIRALSRWWEDNKRVGQDDRGMTKEDTSLNEERSEQNSLIANTSVEQYRDNTVIKVTPYGLRKLTFFDEHCKK